MPEIADGLVEIRGVAREPGYRSKIAVESHAQGVDPVGACVGPRGSRVRMVVSELRGEKIDIIPWNTEPARFIAKALSPARVREVFVDDDTKEATVVVPEDQLALAIGKEGLNARLAARLTGWKVDIQSDQEFAQAEAEAAFVGDEGAGGDFSGRCVAVLANGKRCPNTTLPGSRFCGIPAHQEMAQLEAAGEEVRTIDTVRSEEPDETDTDVETEVAAEADESGGAVLRPEIEGEVNESGDAIREPEVVAAAQEEPCLTPPLRCLTPWKAACPMQAPKTLRQPRKFSSEATSSRTRPASQSTRRRRCWTKGTSRARRDVGSHQDLRRLRAEGREGRARAVRGPGGSTDSCSERAGARRLHVPAPLVLRAGAVKESFRPDAASADSGRTGPRASLH